MFRIWYDLFLLKKVLKNLTVFWGNFQTLLPTKKKRGLKSKKKKTNNT